jgi:hypothetical protein
MGRLSKIEHFLRPGARSNIAMNEARSLNDAFVALQPFELVRDPRSLRA